MIEGEEVKNRSRGSCTSGAAMHFALFVLGCNPVQDHKRSNFGIHSVILGQYKLFGLAPRTFANLE